MNIIIVGNIIIIGTWDCFDSLFRNTMAEQDEPIFQDLKAGVENPGATVIESLCVNCFENVS